MDSFGASRGRRKKRLGDLLIEGGLINDEQLQQALQAQKESDVRQKLGTVLIDLGFASDDDIAVEFDEGSLGGLSYRRQCAHIG